jgi:hypothetical protein
VNGAVYNQSQIPSQPIGGVGEGRKGWKSWSEAINRKFCFGMTADGRRTRSGMPAYAIDPMMFAYSQLGTSAETEGQTIPFYTVSDRIRRNYPYGLGCVGVLVKPGGWPVADDLAGGWQNGQSLGPNARLSRTILAWTSNRNFFLITCTSPLDKVKGITGADWTDSVNFVADYLPKALQSEYGWMLRGRRRIAKIDGAVMLDGGGSTMFGYERRTCLGWVNLDRGAPHGPDPADGIASTWPFIPDFVYAVARSR